MIASEFAGGATLQEHGPLFTPRADCTATGGMGSAKLSLTVAAFVLFALLLPLLRGFDKPAKAMDEGSLLVYPELILKGEVPYRDFETFYGPANIYLLSGVYAVFGPGILAERATGLVYRLLILGAVFCLARQWGLTLAARGDSHCGSCLAQPRRRRLRLDGRNCVRSVVGVSHQQDRFTHPLLFRRNAGGGRFAFPA